MIGASHLAFAIILLISTSIAIYFSIIFYGEKNKKGSSEPLYFIFSTISFFVSISLVYYTRDIKTMESVYWINQFLSANRNTFFVSCFNQIYDSYSIMDKFVHTRVINVHDSLICITVITFVIYVFFTFKFKKVSKIKNLKRPKKIKNKILLTSTEEDNNTNANEEQSASIHDDDNPFAPTEDISTLPPKEIQDQPWVIRQSDESETQSSQKPWVLPPSNQEEEENKPLDESKPPPKPQNEYEYEYEYDYD